MKKLALTTVTLLSLYVADASAVLDAVIVSGARTEQSTLTTPASISIITREQIEATGAEHIIDVLRGVGGIYVRDTFGDGSRTQVSMRGFSGSTANANTLIMIDGRRLNNTDLSNPDLNSVSLKDIVRIEIVQGSSGVLFGDQAVGGVVNIITTKANDTSGTVEAAYGSYDTARLQATYGAAVNESLHYRVSAEFRQSDNYRRENNAIEYSNLLFKTGYDYTGGELYAEVQHIAEDLELPGSLLQTEITADRRQTFVDFLNDFTNSKTDVLRLGTKHNLSGNWALEGELSYRDVERDIQQSFRGFVVNTSSRLKRKQLEFTPRLVGMIPMDTGSVQITSGIDLIDTDFDSQITVSSDEQRMLAAYVQAVLPMSEAIDVTLGFRRATVEDNVTSGFTNGRLDESASVFELGLSYRLDAASRLFARLDQNFRFAKVDELTYVSPGTQLKPQTGNSIELGWSHQSAESRYQLSVFQLELQDEIAFDSTAPQPTGAFFAGANVNFDPTTHRGLIAEASQQLTQQLGLTASYSYNDASFDSGVFAGKQISGVPENTARLGLDYRFQHAYRVTLEGVYIGSHYLDGDNANAQAKVSGYSVINSNLVYSMKDWTLSLRINNLTDRKYFENANSFGSRFPMPERNVLLKANWKFK